MPISYETTGTISKQLSPTWNPNQNRQRRSHHKMDKRSTADRLQALEALKRGGKTITVSGVAKKAGLERKTIYNHPELLLRVKQVAETRNAANQGSEPNLDRGKSPKKNG